MKKKKDKERKRKIFSIPLFINMKNIFSIFFFCELCSSLLLPTKKGHKYEFGSCAWPFINRLGALGLPGLDV
jgi:hypothetical protein